MAGDWIKMRSNLWDDPRVGAVVDATEATEAAVVGALYWLWATADQHTADGFMPGLTLRQIDRKTGVKGFAAALCAIGWLSDSEDGVTINNFSDHNGSSAKRRCTDAQRKSGVRSMSASKADKVETKKGQHRTNLGAREEKRREEDSVTGVTGGEPPSARDEVFANGVPLLMAAAVPEKNARSMLSMLCKKHGEIAVAQAVAQTAKDHAGEPVSWIQTLLNAGSGPPPKRANAQEALEASNRAVIDRMLEREKHATQ